MSSMFRRFFLPPSLDPGWERLRRRMTVNSVMGTAALVAFAFAASVALDLPMVHNIPVFTAAVLVRYFVVVASLSVIPIVGMWNKRILLKHMTRIIISVIFVAIVGLIILSSPLYLATQPPGSGEFSIARVTAVWIILVVLPLHHVQAMGLALVLVLTYVAITVAFTKIPAYWLMANTTAMLGASLTGLFATYNRDVQEYRFFRALSTAVRKMDARSTQFGALTGGSSALPPRSTREAAYEPSVHPLILQSLHASIQKAMIEAEGDVDRVDGEDELATKEATRLQLMLSGFNESVRVHMGIFKEFNDVMTERAFRADFSTNKPRLLAIRFSLSLTALMLVVMWVYEIIMFGGESPSSFQLLTILRFAMSVPVLLMLVAETFAPRAFIRNFHPLLLSLGVMCVVLFQAGRVWAIVEVVGSGMVGEADLNVRMYTLSIIRMLEYIVCGLPLRLPWALGTTIISWFACFVVIFAGTQLTVQSMWQHIIFYPFLVVCLGSWRALLEDNKARVIFVVQELNRWQGSGSETQRL